jgi:Flp pilus assembly protein TadB
VSPFIQLVSSLREQMQASLSRSDVLRPLAAIIGILLTALCILALGKAPSWLLISNVVALGVFIAIYAFAYVYCLLTDRDALRSEKYSLHKLAIEHGLIGDANSGLIDASNKKPQERIGVSQ